MRSIGSAARVETCWHISYTKGHISNDNGVSDYWRNAKWKPKSDW